MKERDIYELIERYLLKRTTTGETSGIEGMIKSDPSFAMKVARHEDMQKLITDYSLVQVKETLSKIRQDKLAKIKSRKNLYRNILIGSSYAIILTISSLLIIKKEDNAVRPASEAPEASEAFSDTLASFSGKRKFKKVKPVEKSKQAETVTVNDSSEIKPVEAKYNTRSEKDSTENKKSVPPFEDKKPITDISTDYSSPRAGKHEDVEANDNDNLPCEIKADFRVEPSCNNKATGQIEFIESSISGGEPPYQFTINVFFSDSLVYRDLNPGNYQLKVKDASGCITGLGIATIGVENCFGEYIFAPLYGEIWEIPVENNQPGELFIFNKGGILVYKLKFNGFGTETWDGRSLNNEALPMAAYPFRIVYDNGKVFEGIVTIKR